jgi:hypothetical protein
MHSSTKRKIADLSADQWGMFTAAQAKHAGLSLVALSRLVSTGSLERVRWGVYRIPGTPESRLSEQRAAWLSLKPETPAWERLRKPENDFVVAGFSATWILDVSDHVPRGNEFITRSSQQRKGDGVKIRRRSSLSGDQVQIVDGLPLLAPNALIEDLAASSIDVDELFGVVNEIGLRQFDFELLIDSLAQATKSYGWHAKDVTDRLLENVTERLQELLSLKRDLEQFDAGRQ